MNDSVSQSNDTKSTIQLTNQSKQTKRQSKIFQNKPSMVIASRIQTNVCVLLLLLLCVVLLLLLLLFAAAAAAAAAVTAVTAVLLPLL